MFGIERLWIVLIILAIALIMFGPARLPELGASLGRALREFRKGTAEMAENLKEEVTKPIDAPAGTTHAAVATPPAAEPPPPVADPSAANK